MQSSMLPFSFPPHCFFPFLHLIMMAAVVDAQYIPVVEMTSLSMLHDSTKGDSWLWHDDELISGAVWNFTQDAGGNFVHNPCSSSAATNQTWQGVTCSQTPLVCSSQTCHITGIDLTLYGLSGSIPPEISNLSFLDTLVVNENQLTGPIPPEVSNLVALTHFSVYFNELTGSIPAEIGQVQALTYLDLDENGFIGTIPDSIGNLTALVIMYIGESYVTGTIPSVIGQLTSLQMLAINKNLLNGTIPSSVGQLSALTRLTFDNNQLTGTIPDVVWQLTDLRILRFHRNQLIGSLPSEVGQLMVLERLVLHANKLTSTIPSEVGQLTALKILYLYHNLLTQEIPSGIGDLLGLEQLALHSNQLTATIPSTVWQLTALTILYLNDNQLTGSIPAGGKLKNLEILYLSQNYLTGSIPNALGMAAATKNIYLNDNQLTGTIPSTVGYLENLRDLWLHDNHFEGSLPAEMSTMKNLESLFLQNNKFTGHIQDAFNHSTQLALAKIDLSKNRLTGSLSSTMFLLPQLRVLSLSVNCFENELPQSLCMAERVEVLSLNGLQASKGCRNQFVVPLSGVQLFNTIGGTIPACVWMMRNLSTLHLTGNGLLGDLVQTLPVDSQIADLSLAHNQLSGTIPVDILNIRKLDLSNNQFSGEYLDGSITFPDSNIKLEINRLSGQIPVSELLPVPASNGSLSVLRGNMFSCNTIPENDNFSQDYICGSQNLNEALYMFVTVFGLAMMLVVFGGFARFALSVKQHRLMEHIQSRGVLLWTYLTYVKDLDSHGHHNHFLAIRKIALISRAFIKIMKYAMRLLLVILVSSMMLYILFLVTNHSYATHSHTYAWFWTLAFMSGELPAALLILIWALAITAAGFRILIFKKSENKKTPHKCPELDTEIIKFRDHAGPIAAAFVFNAVINFTVNVLYIYSTQQGLGSWNHFYIQLSVSSFRLLYTAVVLPLLSRPIRSLLQNVRFRFLLLMINDLLLPCVVTLFTNPTCFQGVLTPANEVSTHYSYSICETYTTLPSGETYCSREAIEQVDSALFVPPFIYNNQCQSAILTSYIPVFLLSFAIQLLLPFVTLTTLAFVPYGSLPPFIREMFHGIIWPEYWRQGAGQGRGGTGGGGQDARSEKEVSEGRMSATKKEFSSQKHNHKEEEDEQEAMRVLVQNNKDTLERDPSIVLETRTIFCSDVLNNILLMMTFGLCSPVLAVAIACAVMLKMSFWVLLIGRFVRCFLRDKENGTAGARSATTAAAATAAAANTTTSDVQHTKLSFTEYGKRNVNVNAHGDGDDGGLHIHFALESLAHMHIPLLAVLEGSFWRIAWCSALFVALLSWDIATDDVGYLKSLWVLFVPLGYVLVLHILAYFYHRDAKRKNNNPLDEKKKTSTSATSFTTSLQRGEHERGSSIEMQNPIHSASVRL